jgi:hypothetical protein
VVTSLLGLVIVSHLSPRGLGRFTHPIVKRLSRALQHVVLYLEYTSIEVLVALIEGLEVPTALASQVIRSPHTRHE